MPLDLGGRVVPVRPGFGRLLGGSADAEAGQDVVGRTVLAGAPRRTGAPPRSPVRFVRHATSTR
jgi:hypothetical protein